MPFHLEIPDHVVAYLEGLEVSEWLAQGHAGCVLQGEVRLADAATPGEKGDGLPAQELVEQEAFELRERRVIQVAVAVAVQFQAPEEVSSGALPRLAESPGD